MALTDSNIFSIEGIRLPKDAFVVMLRTAWNAHVVDKLHQGAEAVLNKACVTHETFEVPGAFEIGFGIKHHWDVSRRPHAYIALGCVLRGDTPHFDYVCRAVTDSIVRLNLELPVPVIFGVLTVDNDLQAAERTGGKHGNKGEEAAATALQMISFSGSLRHKEI